MSQIYFLREKLCYLNEMNTNFLIFVQLYPPPTPLKTNAQGQVDFGVLTASGPRFVTFTDELQTMHVYDKYFYTNFYMLYRHLFCPPSLRVLFKKCFIQNTLSNIFLNDSMRKIMLSMHIHCTFMEPNFFVFVEGPMNSNLKLSTARQSLYWVLKYRFSSSLI